MALTDAPQNPQSMLEWVAKQIAIPNEMLVMNTRAYDEFMRQMSLMPMAPRNSVLEGVRVVRSTVLDNMSGGVAYRVRGDVPMVYSPPSIQPEVEFQTSHPFGFREHDIHSAFWRVSLAADCSWTKYTPHERRCMGANGPRRGQRRLLALRKRRYAKRKRAQ